MTPDFGAAPPAKTGLSVVTPVGGTLFGLQWVTGDSGNSYILVRSADGEHWLPPVAGIDPLGVTSPAQLTVAGSRVLVTGFDLDTSTEQIWAIDLGSTP